MPIYEYQCPGCHHRFEELVRSREAASEVVCPACGHDEVIQELSVFAARQGASVASAPPLPGPCGQCGDPSGPCPLRDAGR